MTLTPSSSIGPNPQIPGSAAELYVPDQLVAGNEHLVTDNATVLGGLAAPVVRGTVLGKILDATPTVAAGTNTGNGTVTALSTGASADLGAYKLTATSATNFTVTGPNGSSMPPATVGTPYTDAKLNFTINAGGTAFVAGDSFTVTVPAGSGSVVPCIKTATDGSQIPYAIAAETVDTTSAGPNAGASLNCGVYLKGEFNQRAVIIDGSWTLALLKAAFRPVAIYFKDSVSAADPT